MLRRVLPGTSLILLFLTGSALACDGWREIEQEKQRFDELTLTDAQKAKIDVLKKAAIDQFAKDHENHECDAAHRVAVAHFVAEADKALTNAQRVEFKTNARIEALEAEIKSLRAELQELRRLIRVLIDDKHK